MGGGREAVIVVPAFAEEMNKSRRQVALLARALARINVTTLVPDFHGTGDSDGKFGEATVGRWREDFQSVCDFARAQSFDSINLVAVRGGALLCVDFLAHCDLEPSRTIWWHPAVSGKTLISQFLRLKAAASLTGGGGGAGVRDLRETLAAGNPVEVAGYELSSALVQEFDELHLRDAPACGALHWLDVGAHGTAPPPAAQGVLEKQPGTIRQVVHRRRR